MVKYNDLYLDIRALLKRSGIEDTTQAAKELVCIAAGKTKNELLRDGLLYVPPEVEREAYALAERHIAGEPVAYLIGEWEFYGLPFDISPAVLIPRPDTEILCENVIRELQGEESCRVLDLCAGSGCVGIAVAKHVEGARVTLGEISEDALKICRQNIRRNNLTARISAMRIDAREKPSRQLGEFHCIVSNPPYIPSADIETLDSSVREYEPHLALDGGEDGLDFYRIICEKWRDALLPGGLLAFEVGIGQADEVLRIMRASGFGEIEIIRDLHMIPRVVYGRRFDEI
ncbi:MAG: peptide chain release factor N(5)-glutamine methyltransferase [Oscillospiraceae bacterium]|jgi:release factor glutamine methyltransferase|nr:peptide chain release factor N(5)-glutamine methyltransferase [Oscillospiraceae bacterium]MBQ5739436.1 peptide chain release factor N(5)-glutamine methyltransferase [Oscillospiraceae bacterium]